MSKVEKTERILWSAIKACGRAPGEPTYWTVAEDIAGTAMRSAGRSMEVTTPVDGSFFLSWMVCLDEARRFNRRPKGCKHDLLTQFIRAARLLPQGAVLVFMDTLSQLRVLFPRTLFSSERMIDTGSKLAVLTDILSWDLGARTFKEQVPQTIHESTRVEFMSLYGRPMWNAMRESQDHTMILKTAQLKLLGKRRDSRKNPSRLGRLALLASLIDFDVNPLFKSTFKMVGSFLAHLDYYHGAGELCTERVGKAAAAKIKASKRVSLIKSRKVTQALIISYPSDPIVSTAASEFIQHQPDAIAAALATVESHVQSRIVLGGERGELVAQLLCIIASNDASKSPVEPVMVKGFLRSLLGTEHYKQLVLKVGQSKSWEAVSKGLVNFNHFVKVRGYTPNRGDMEEFVRHRAAIMCKDCQRGIDIIIPVVLRQAYGESRVGTQIDLGETGVRVKRKKNGWLIPTNRREELARVSGPGMEECLSELRSSLIAEYELPPPASLLAGLFPREPATSDGPARKNVDAPTVDDPPIESTHISYILIQCKNYSSERVSSFFSPRDLVGMNPFDAGIEEVGKREDRYMTDDRPYISLAMFFNRGGKSELRTGLSTYPENCVYNGDSVVSFSLLNGHLESEFAGGLEGLLRAAPSAVDIAQEKGEKLAKVVQKFGERGTRLADISDSEQDDHDSDGDFGAGILETSGAVSHQKRPRKGEL